MSKRVYLPASRADKSHKGYVTGGPNSRNFVVTDPEELLRLAEACLVTARKMQSGEATSVRLYTPVYERKQSKPAGYLTVTYVPVAKDAPKSFVPYARAKVAAPPALFS